MEKQPKRKITICGYAEFSGTPAAGITTAGEEHTPMTFYCLVDVSGSMGQEQMDQAKAVLTAISQGDERER